MLLEKARRFRETNPESRRQSYSRWRDKNIDRERERSKEWSRNNKSKVAATHKIYYNKNYPKIREAVRKSRIKRRKLMAGSRIETIGPFEWSIVLSLWKNRCAYCGVGGKMTQDHITPLSKGGSHTLDNIVPACIDCNRAKGTKDVEDFIQAASNSNSISAT